MSEKIRKAYPLTPPRPDNKWHAKRQGAFDSGIEARRGWELSLLEKSGQIFDLRHHSRFVLLPSAPELGFKNTLEYESDFDYWTMPGKGAGTYVVEDCKGVPTPAYLIKKRMLKQLHGVEITEIRYK